MIRRSVNPTEWGLQYLMDQGQVVSGATRHLRMSGQAAMAADPDSPLGVVARHPGDMRGQIAAALANIDAVLEGAGMGRGDLVSLRFFVTDVDAYLENYDVYADWIAPTGLRPPQSLLGVARLALPELMIEIEAEAAA